MSEEMPPIPHRERVGQEKIALPDEIRAVTGMFELTRRLRAKNPDNPAEVDKSPEDIEESVGDHIAMVAYLTHYFLPLLEERGEPLNFERTFDMVLAHDIGHVSESADVPGVQKTLENKREEVIATAKIFGTLPKRNGFNRTLFNAYAEYLGRETRESRFVRGLNGLETMLYVLSKPPSMRQALVGGKGYALEDYRNRIGHFCQEFAPLREFYTRIERLFEGQDYFAESRVYDNGIVRPEILRSLLISNAPDFGDENTTDINAENNGLLQLYRLKRRLRFGQASKHESEHHDTDTEHVAELLFLARYFLPILKSDPAQKRRDDLSFQTLSEIILAHDAPEGLTGDKITGIKTFADALAETEAAKNIVQNYAPRAGEFNLRFASAFVNYEFNKTDLTFPSNATLAKSLDVLEGQLYIYDPKTREKLGTMPFMPFDDIHKKIDRLAALFPVVKAHYDALEQKFRVEGLW